MTGYEDLKHNIEQAVHIKQELYRLKREIFDLQQCIEYMNDHNLTYYDKEMLIKMSFSDLISLIESRKKRATVLENLFGCGDKIN